MKALTNTRIWTKTAILLAAATGLSVLASVSGFAQGMMGGPGMGQMPPGGFGGGPGMGGMGQMPPGGFGGGPGMGGMGQMPPGGFGGGPGMGGLGMGGPGGPGMGGPGGPGMGGPGMGGPGGPGGGQPSVIGGATYELDGSKISEEKKVSKLSKTASTVNETVVRVKNGAKLSVDELDITKTGNCTSEEESNFYSLNSAVAAWAGSELNIKKGSISTNANGANAVFAWGEKSHVTVKDLTITTKQNSSRGLDATYGGHIDGENLTISTEGAHCAALATDRGEGFVYVKNVTATTRGEGSPGIYSTGDIRATDSKFTAYGSEAAVIEGKNSIQLTDCELTGHRLCGAMLYQSFSGDAGVGTSIMKMSGGTLTAETGPLFYVTNTHARLELNGVKLEKKGDLLVQAQADRWGTVGRNGGNLTLTAEDQTLDGNVTVDQISEITILLKKGATLTGAINTAANAGKVHLSLGEGAVWNVTADSSVDEFGGPGSGANELLARIKSNGHTIYYRVKEGYFEDGKTYDLDNGGKLVYKAAPEIDYDAVSAAAAMRGRPGEPGGGPGGMMPPGGFGGGPGGPGMGGPGMGGPGMGEPPGGFGGGPGMGQMPPGGFGGPNGMMQPGGPNGMGGGMMQPGGPNGMGRGMMQPGGPNGMGGGMMPPGGQNGMGGRQNRGAMNGQGGRQDRPGRQNP